MVDRACGGAARGEHDVGGRSRSPNGLDMRREGVGTALDECDDDAHAREPGGDLRPQ